jgi:hypothetical protein
MLEQEQDAERAAVYTLLKACENDLKHAELNGQADVHRRSRDAVQSLRDRWERIEDKSNDPSSMLNRIRTQFIEADEKLRFLERVQAFERERVLRRVEAAEESVRKLQQDSSRAIPAIQASAELERKINRLLRDVSELRREIRRQPSDQSQESSSRRRSGQP